MVARDWAIGASVGGAGSILLALRGLIPDFFSIVAANTGLVVGQACLFMGNRRFLGWPPSSRWVWGGAMLRMAVLFGVFT